MERRASVCLKHQSYVYQHCFCICYLLLAFGTCSSILCGDVFSNKAPLSRRVCSYHGEEDRQSCVIEVAMASPPLVAGALSAAWSLRRRMKYACWTATIATTQNVLHNGLSTARYAPCEELTTKQLSCCYHGVEPHQDLSIGLMHC